VTIFVNLRQTRSTLAFVLPKSLANAAKYHHQPKNTSSNETTRASASEDCVRRLGVIAPAQEQLGGYGRGNQDQEENNVVYFEGRLVFASQSGNQVVDFCLQVSASERQKST